MNCSAASSADSWPNCTCCAYSANIVFTVPDPVGAGTGDDEPFARTEVMDWTEPELAGDPEERRRALNGFAVVRLDGAEIAEAFYGEEGSMRHRIAPVAAAA